MYHLLSVRLLSHSPLKVKCIACCLFVFYPIHLSKSSVSLAVCSSFIPFTSQSKVYHLLSVRLLSHSPLKVKCITCCSIWRGLRFFAFNVQISAHLKSSQKTQRTMLFSYHIVHVNYRYKIAVTKCFFSSLKRKSSF